MSSSQPRKPRVAVVFGGRSSEHSVSCVTAASVMAAIDPDRYDVLAIGITRAGVWTLVGDEVNGFAFGGAELPYVPESGPRVAIPLGAPERHLLRLAPGSPPVDLGPVDVVVPLLHGPYGEDGTIQGLLELAGMRYVGAGVLSSAVMMDKEYMKLAFAAAGLPIGPYVVIRDRRWQADRVAALADCAALRFPVFVKPCRAGSSMGITRVVDVGGLESAIEDARSHDPKVIVEEGIAGREIECGVLQGRGDGPDRASELGEVRVAPGFDFYDFEAKYIQEGGVTLSCPADLPTADALRMQQMALEAFAAGSCEGLARVDFFYRVDGTVILNEINTMPGFTPTSMFPYVWKVGGMSYPELIEELIQLAVERRIGLR
ncbi:MAG: D-alanine--D-alanine ligase family protein [Dermatophilaceae bacterium]